MQHPTVRPLRVNFVLKDRGWIVDKMSRRLAEHLPAWGVTATIGEHPSPDVDVNHWLYTDIEIGARVQTRHTLFVTHVDRLAKVVVLKRHLQIADLGMCESRMTVRQLVDHGVAPAKLCFINPAHDGAVSPKRLVIGITSRVRQDGAKREYLLVRLAAEMRLDAFHFDIIGRGWDDIVPHLEDAGATVSYHRGSDDAEADYRVNLERIPRFDYYLYTGLDEGSMGFLDALAAGVPTIVTAQGFHADAEGGITHPFVDFEELHRIFRAIAEARQKRIDSVSSWTWQEYARLHALAWHGVVNGDGGETISRRLHEGRAFPPEAPAIAIPRGWRRGDDGGLNWEALRGDVAIVAQSRTYGTSLFKPVQAIGGRVWHTVTRLRRRRHLRVLLLVALLLVLPRLAAAVLHNVLAVDLSHQVVRRSPTYVSSGMSTTYLALLADRADHAAFGARVLFWQGKDAEALHAFRGVPPGQPDSEWLLQVGVAASARGRAETGERALRLYVALNPKEGDGHLALGRALRLAGKYAAARDSYRTACQVEPALAAQANFLIGQTYATANAFLDGLPPLEEALRLDARSHSLHVSERIAASYWIGIAHLWKGDPAGAELRFRQALSASREPGGEILWLVCSVELALGRTLTLQHRDDEARTVLEWVMTRCRERPADVAAARSELGVVR